MFKLTLLLLLILLAAPFVFSEDGPTSSGLKEGGIDVREDSGVRKVLVSKNLFIAINTQETIPMLFFGKVNDTIRYKLRMGGMFQLKSNATLLKDGNVLEGINLNNFNWQFSANQVDASNETVQFSLTTTTVTPRVQFRFTIAKTTFSFKYDVIISGFDNRWKVGANYLAICHELKLQSGDDENDSSHEMKPTRVEQKSGDDNKVVIQNAGYMHVEPIATSSTNEKIKVSLKHLSSEDETNQQEQKVCILYERWIGTLEHDPTLGTTSSATPISFAVALFALVFALVL